MSGSKPYFDALGAGWDRLQESFFSDRVRGASLVAGNLGPGQRAADLGAGTGFITRGLLEGDISVIAVDQSQAMLDALRAKHPACAELECRVGEAERIPVDDAAVDGCFANMFLHHVERPAIAIREMARIVRPGGRIVVTDLDRHDFAFLRDEHRDRWMGFEHADVRRWFEQAGLVAVEVRGLDQTCCTDSADGKSAAIGIFLAAGTRPGE